MNQKIANLSVKSQYAEELLKVIKDAGYVVVKDDGDFPIPGRGGNNYIIATDKIVDSPNEDSVAPL